MTNTIIIVMLHSDGSGVVIGLSFFNFMSPIAHLCIHMFIGLAYTILKASYIDMAT